MSRDYQIEQLRNLLMDPKLSSGLYLIDTDLSDSDIEIIIKGIIGCKYIKEPLIPSKQGCSFELFVTGLSHKCDTDEIRDLRRILMVANGSQKDIILYNLLINMIGYLCSEWKTIIHIYGEQDITGLSHEDLYKLNEALLHQEKTVVIICKSKNSKIPVCDHIITYQSFKKEKIFIKMTSKSEIVHISYKHDEAYRDVITAIKAGLDKCNIAYSIDEYDIMYRDNIDDYEKGIGASDKVIMFVVPSYLKSLDCMFEMTQMFKNGNIRERIFPVVDMGGISRDGDGLKQIKEYWHDELVRKSEQIKREPGGSSFVLQEIQKINDIIKTLDDLWFFLCREFSGKFEKLIENDASLLVKELKKTLQNVEPMIDETFVPTRETMPEQKRTIIQNGPNSLYVENNVGAIIIGSGISEKNNIMEKTKQVKNDAYFDRIADQIIKDLDQARVSIHVCMAWFTNQRIADKLIEKYKEGIDVKVISFDDHTNAKFGVSIDTIPHKKVRGSRGGTMHNKFCIIDNQKVITGSYNWSDNAENKNDENAAVMYDYDRASDYSVKFRELFEGV